MQPKWFGAHLAYTMSKYGMSQCVLGLAHEFAGRVGVNALWPETLIATAAVQNLLGGDAAVAKSRKPEIVADAAYAILCRDAKSCSGNFFLDVDVLKEAGKTDLAEYAALPGTTTFEKDLFLD